MRIAFSTTIAQLFRVLYHSGLIACGSQFWEEQVSSDVFVVQYKKVAPVGDRVFVKIDKEEDKTTSGILLPSSAQKKPTQGEIVDIGDAKALKVQHLRAIIADICFRLIDWFLCTALHLCFQINLAFFDYKKRN